MDTPIRELVHENLGCPSGHSAAWINDVVDLMQHCQIVSFDVFDTLLVRRIASPSEVFEVVARQTGIPDFRERRVKAEACARSRQRLAHGHTEVTLSEIYFELKGFSGDRKTQLMAVELEAERSLLHANPRIGPLYDAAVQLGKTIVAASDVYLPSVFITTVLSQLGLPVSQVFASGDIGYSKHAGDMFEHIAATFDIDTASILHIGDNLVSDFQSPLKAGCIAVHAINDNDRLFRDWRCNQAAIAGLVKSSGNLFASFILAHVARANASTAEFSGQELFGRMYGGPMLFAFAHWLEQKRQVDGVNRLFLLARDGYAIAQALNLLGSSASLTVMHSSRRMCRIATLEEDFEQSCRDIAMSSIGATARDLVKGLELSNETALLDALGRFIALDRKIAGETDAAQLNRALHRCRELLIRIAREEQAALKEYLRPLRLADPDCAIVDCGWALTTHRRLEMLIGSRIRGYYVGTLDHAHHHEKIDSFLFEKDIVSQWKLLHSKAVEVLELPFITNERRSIRMLSDGHSVKPLLSSREVTIDQTRSVFAASIQREALTFCHKVAAFSRQFRISEIEEAIGILFSSLIEQPTDFEYFLIQSIPHVRTVGISDVRTIGDYWHRDLTGRATINVGLAATLVRYLSARLKTPDFRCAG